MSSIEDQVARAVAAATTPKQVEKSVSPEALNSETSKRRRPVILITDLEALGEFCGWPGLFDL